jgi:hypothetical protein
VFRGQLSLKSSARPDCDAPYSWRVRSVLVRERAIELTQRLYAYFILFDLYKVFYLDADCDTRTQALVHRRSCGPRPHSIVQVYSPTDTRSPQLSLCRLWGCIWEGTNAWDIKAVCAPGRARTRQSDSMLTHGP